jgi:hypothetical protein
MVKAALERVLPWLVEKEITQPGPRFAPTPSHEST